MKVSRLQRYRDIESQLKDGNCLTRDVADKQSCSVNLVSQYLREMRQDGWPVRIADWVQVRQATTPVFGYGFAPDADRPPARKAPERIRRRAPVLHKAFPDGEWDNTIFDMSQYRCVPNSWDAWLFDKRAA